VAFIEEKGDPVAELDARADEMSPHQRAMRVVLSVWTSLSVPASIFAAAALALWVAWQRPGFVDGTTFLITYFLVGVPSALVLFAAQSLSRKALARRVLKSLDAPVRGALSGRETSAAFQATRDTEAVGDTPPRSDQ
jgi:hypothetical protein